MSIEEKFAVQEVMARYSHTIDRYDSVGWAECFTPDGVFEIEAGPGGPRSAFEGREALIEFADTHARLLPNTRHAMSGHLTEIDGDTAYNTALLLGLVSRPDKVHVYASGWYETWFEKREGEWRITRSIGHCDNFAPELFENSELTAIFGELNEWVANNATPVGSGS